LETGGFELWLVASKAIANQLYSPHHCLFQMGFFGHFDLTHLDNGGQN